VKANGEELKKKDLSTEKFQEMKSGMHDLRAMRTATAQKDAATRLTRSEIMSQ
jgi:hypothetical protein